MRRMQLHRRIGARLEAGYGARARDLAARLAVHFERSGEIPRAVHYWQQAGEDAARRSAHHEAIALLSKGLALLATLPESLERAQHELTLQLTLGALLAAAKGLGAQEGYRVYIRAYELCQQVGDPGQRFQALHGLERYHRIQAELRTAVVLAEQALDLAQRQSDATLCPVAEYSLGSIRFFLGSPSRPSCTWSRVCASTASPSTTRLLSWVALTLACLAVPSAP